MRACKQRTLNKERRAEDAERDIEEHQPHT
jgi:hypothetical protein